MDYTPVRGHGKQARIVINFSCGVTSAVACKLTLQDYPNREILILNAFLQEEHEDNQRFKADCEKWFEHPIVTVRDEVYGASVHEVWRRRRYVKGPQGAPCSQALKRDVLAAASVHTDIFVLGYTAEEEERVDQFIAANNGRRIITPLINYGLTKSDCLALVERAGIKLPAMYLLGFNNNNCIGCCKGGMGYMNRVRQHFPERFNQLVQIQEQIGPGSYIFFDRTTLVRFGLKDLPLDAGTHDEPEISCSAHCELVESEFTQ